MNSSDYRTTALLTEHLGFPPLTLIDNVINAVNEILGKCTDALEDYLVKRSQARLAELATTKSNDNTGSNTTSSVKNFPPSEITLGTAEIESLLQVHIDKNFDKFELYALRNIFTVPKELVEGGWIRLKHYEGIDFDIKDTQTTERMAKDLDAQLQKLISDISVELKLRQILKLQVTKARKLVATLREYRQVISIFSTYTPGTDLSPDAALAFKALTPVDENLHFIFTQVDELIKQAQLLNDRFFKHDGLRNEIRTMDFVPTPRDKYIQTKTRRLLESVGIITSLNTASTSEPTPRP